MTLTIEQQRAAHEAAIATAKRQRGGFLEFWGLVGGIHNGSATTPCFKDPSGEYVNFESALDAWISWSPPPQRPEKELAELADWLKAKYCHFADTRDNFDRIAAILRRVDKVRDVCQSGSSTMTLYDRADKADARDMDVSARILRAVAELLEAKP